MSKKNKNPPKSAQDSFKNELARLGQGQSNVMNSGEYTMTRYTRDYNLMNTLYRNNWIAKKIINSIPEDMCKNWFSINAELTPDVQDRYTKLETRTKIKEKFVECLMWARLYGGAGALVLIEGHEDILDEPLELESIMPNSFKGLMVLDRWSGIYPDLKLIDDISDEDFGLPEYYDIKNSDQSIIQKVHHSRIIRFEGRKLPFWESQAEVYWGASELEHVFDELLKRDSTSFNIASLVFQANLLVNKVDGMEQMLSLGDPEAQRNFYNTKEAINQMRNNSSMMIVGKEEEISSLQYSFTGLNDIYESFMLDIAGASEIPVTKLFGRSPAGLSATGESDLQNYYDMISQQQERYLKYKIMKLLPIIFVSEFGQVPEDLDIKFNPIKSPSDEEMADIVGKKVGSIKDVYDSGIINQKHALSELHNLSYTTNMFTSITDEDIEMASTNFVDESMLGGVLGAEESTGINVPTNSKKDS